MNPFNWINRLTPRTGRVLREAQQTWNEGDWGHLAEISDTVALVLKGRGFFWQNQQINLANGASYYYSLNTGSKYMVIYNRSLDGAEGPIQFDTVVGATFTPGTPISSVNLHTGGPAPESVLTLATGVVGGVTIPNDYVFAAGNKAGVAGSSGLPTLLPPNFEVLVKVTNLSTGVNAGIRLALAYGEIPAEDMAGLIGGIT